MLVQYSVSFPPGTQPSRMLAQLRLSLWSLRRHNRRVPAIVLVYDSPPAELGRICASYGAELVAQGSYAERLAPLCPEGWPVLVANPTLHKFLSHGRVAEAAARCCAAIATRCSTATWSGLFDAYADADVYAREEVHTGPSRYGPDRAFLDEPALRRGSQRRSASRAVPPCNTGVVIVNHGRAADLARLDELVRIRCVWHLVVWMSARCPSMLAGAATAPSRAVDTAFHLASATSSARGRCPTRRRTSGLSRRSPPGSPSGRSARTQRPVVCPRRDVPQNGELADAGDLAADRLAACATTSPPIRHTALTWLARRAARHVLTRS